MTATQTGQSGTTRIFDTIEHFERAALEAARKVLDTVDGAFPDLGDDGPRRKIIDSAFNTTEQLLSASTRLAQNILEATEKALT
jgi:hypothetical protein